VIVPTRKTQPYRRKGGMRPLGRAMQNMTRGKGALSANPQDAQRQMARHAQKARRRGRGRLARARAGR
jgi:hypothetical protein